MTEDRIVYGGRGRGGYKGKKSRILCRVSKPSGKLCLTASLKLKHRSVLTNQSEKNPKTQSYTKILFN